MLGDMVLIRGTFSNHATDDTLIYSMLVVVGVVRTLRFESPWRVLRAWSWKVIWLSKKKKKKRGRKTMYMRFYKFWVGSHFILYYYYKSYF